MARSAQVLFFYSQVVHNGGKDRLVIGGDVLAWKQEPFQQGVFHVFSPAHGVRLAVKGGVLVW